MVKPSSKGFASVQAGGPNARFYFEPGSRAGKRKCTLYSFYYLEEPPGLPQLGPLECVCEGTRTVRLAADGSVFTVERVRDARGGPGFQSSFNPISRTKPPPASWHGELLECGVRELCPF